MPATRLRSRLFSFAIFRTSGEERACSDETEAAADAAASTLGASALGAAGAAATGAAPEAAPPITATTVLIWTVFPASTLIALKTPSAGEGISASTLSVEISNRGSSRRTVSPTCFSHLVIVPSKLDSPICGITTSVPGPAAGAAAGADEEAAGAEEAGATGAEAA